MKKSNRVLCFLVAGVLAIMSISGIQVRASESDFNRATDNRFAATEALLDLRAEMLTKLMLTDNRIGR